MLTTPAFQLFRSPAKAGPLRTICENTGSVNMTFLLQLQAPLSHLHHPRLFATLHHVPRHHQCRALESKRCTVLSFKGETISCMCVSVKAIIIIFLNLLSRTCHPYPDLINDNFFFLSHQTHLIFCLNLILFF